MSPTNSNFPSLARDDLYQKSLGYSSMTAFQLRISPGSCAITKTSRGRFETSTSVGSSFFFKNFLKEVTVIKNL
jgi:hypothetical protein